MAGFRTTEQTPFYIEMRFTMNKLLSCRHCEKAIPTATKRTVGIAFMVKEKENNVLTLVRAGGDALDVELLHDDKQYRDGNGHQYTACTELTKVSIDQTLIQHIVQTDSNSPLGRYAGI